MNETLSQAAELAQKKPGRARDLILAHAEALTQSSPGEVAAFLDEGARVFLDLENLSMASKLFTKAREADRAHPATVDEPARRQLFVDFASLGAISPKELTAEAKDLLRRLPADEALDAHLTLITEIVHGGQPPYPQLSTDLRRLIKAAGANQADVETQLLRDILTAPAVREAPERFWASYRQRIVAMALADPHIRRTLIDLDPTEVEPDTWFDLLSAAGLEAELQQHPSPLRWVERVIHSRWQYTYWGKLSELVRGLPLRGETLRLNHRATPELCDALLEAGAHVPTELLPRWFQGWANAPDAPPLTFLAAHPDAATCGDDIVDVGRRTPELVRHAGARQLLGMWLAEHLGEHATPLTALAALRLIRPICTPEGRVALAEQFTPALESCRPERMLARSLRDGLLVEYCWPALERAADELLRATPDAVVTCHESWPNVGVAAQGHVIWVDGTRQVAEAHFTPKHGTGHHRWRYLLVDGVTGCHWEYGALPKFTWSHDLDTAHPTVKPTKGDRTTFALPHGRLVGVRVVHAGDPQSPFLDDLSLLSDGQSYWVDGRGWREIDPEGAPEVSDVTSLPTRMRVLLDQFAPDQLVRNAFWAPTTPTTAASRLPTQDGYHGWIETMLSADMSRYVQATGHHIDAPAGMAGRILRPGGGSWLFDRDGNLHREDSQPLLRSDDELGHSFLLHRVPSNGWHQFQPRSMEASTRLRNAAPDQVAPIVAAAPSSEVQISPFSTWPTATAPLPTAAKQAAADFLGSTDEALVRAVVWQASRVKAISTLATELLAS
ncbi:MAG: hypothetical protein Q4D79_09720 [Propionibacteriaceae bacterium]|nr:hypothetical protein [Propionibacteriaceae bacterium]